VLIQLPAKVWVRDTNVGTLEPCKCYKIFSSLLYIISLLTKLCGSSHLLQSRCAFVSILREKRKVEESKWADNVYFTYRPCVDLGHSGLEKKCYFLMCVSCGEILQITCSVLVDFAGKLQLHMSGMYKYNGNTNKYFRTELDHNNLLTTVFFYVSTRFSSFLKHSSLKLSALGNYQILNGRKWRERKLHKYWFLHEILLAWLNEGGWD
jgi:hypothetical protein